jgi:hypothetical protein
MGILDKMKKIASETTVSLQDKVSNNLAKASETTVSLKDKVSDNLAKASETAISLQGKVTSNLKNELKPQIIQQAAKINYGEISSALKLLDNEHPVPEIVILSIDLLQNAADEYKQSDKPDRDDEFLSCLVNNVDAKFILASIEPIVIFIPPPYNIYVKMTVWLLKLIVNYKS